MGMYNDHRNVERENWNYEYWGSKLLPFAQKKRDQCQKKEKTARQEMSKLLNDGNVRASDSRIEDLKKDIEKYANMYEKCIVWCHEFSNRPDEKYRLKLGDVSFFDIPQELQDNE